MLANNLSDYGSSELQTCRANVFYLPQILFLGLSSPGSFFFSWQMPVLRKLVCRCGTVSTSHHAHLFDICLVCHMPVLLKYKNITAWLTLQLSKKQHCLLYIALHYNAYGNKTEHQTVC